MSGTSFRPGDVIRCSTTGQLFECVKLLRQGRCSEVWFASRAEPLGTVVLKLISQVAVDAIKADDAEHMRLSFVDAEQECAALEFLNFHANQHVVRREAAPFVYEQHHVLPMEFMAGGDLLDLLARYKMFEEGTARYFFSQLVHNVKYMHDLRVAHLDLSLENVGLSRDYRVAKLLDFGLAASITYNTSGIEERCHRGARGRLFYIAPEVLAEQFFRATAADVWALGIMLFIMLTGSPPLVAGPCDKDPRFAYLAAGKLPSILKAWNLRNKLSSEAVDIVSRLLTVDPDRRITIADVLRHPWLRPPSTTRRATVGVRTHGRTANSNSGCPGVAAGAAGPAGPGAGTLGAAAAGTGAGAGAGAGAGTFAGGSADTFASSTSKGLSADSLMEFFDRKERQGGPKGSAESILAAVEEGKNADSSSPAALAAKDFDDHDVDMTT